MKSKRADLSERLRVQVDHLRRTAESVAGAAAAVQRREDELRRSRNAALEQQRDELLSKDKLKSAATRKEAANSCLAIVETLASPGGQAIAGEGLSAKVALEALDFAGHVRIGSFRPNSSESQVPALLPLLTAGNVVVLADEGQRSAAHDVITSLLARALAGTGPGQLAIRSADPNMTGALRAFNPLAKQNLFLEPADTAAEVSAMIDACADRVARIKYLLGGQENLGALRQVTGQPIENYELNVLLDFPDEVTPECFDQLLKVMANGPAAGTSTILHVRRSAEPPRDRNLKDLFAAAVVIDIGSSHVTASVAPECRLTVDPAFSFDEVEQLAATVAEKAKAGAAPVIPLGDLVPLDSHPTESSALGITATIGKQGLTEVGVTLGDRTEQRHNVLVAGAVGQGKSNLLLTLIHSLAARYGPDELEMYLLDFKQGMEFTPLAPGDGREHWLPNARVIALESDREFGLAVMRHLIGEYKRRTAVVKPHGNDIESFRKACPDERMPRILVVIDEFQTLFETEDMIAEHAMEALETMARKMRAVGIHLVLASQTLSGIKRLAQVEGAIFGQFPTRLALKTTPTESQVVLQTHNTEAAELRYRGEIVVNTDFGNPRANVRASVAYADPDYTDRLRAGLWRAAGDRAIEPVVFKSSEPSDYRVETTTSPAAFFGQTIAVDARPFGFEFTEDPSRNFAILGDGHIDASTVEADDMATNMAFSAIQSGVCSLVDWHKANALDAEILLLDYLPEERSREAGLDELPRYAAENGVTARHLRGEDANGVLVQCAESLSTDTGTKRYVFGIGFDRAKSFDIPLGESEIAPLDALRKLLSEGPSQGSHVIGWWQNLAAYNRHVDYSVDGTINGVLTLLLSREEMRQLFGPIGDWKSQAHRGYLWDRQRADAPVRIIPFAPRRIVGAAT